MNAERYCRRRSHHIRASRHAVKKGYFAELVSSPQLVHLLGAHQHVGLRDGRPCRSRAPVCWPTLGSTVTNMLDCDAQAQEMNFNGAKGGLRRRAGDVQLAWQEDQPADPVAD